MKQNRFNYYTHLQELMEKESMPIELLAYFTGISVPTIKKHFRTGKSFSYQQTKGLAAALGIRKPEEIDYYLFDFQTASQEA